MKHHVEPAELAFDPGDVVPANERTRVCGERSTTPSRRNSRLSLRAWCSSTKEQGFAGREAPRRTAGTRVRAWGRGARRRRDKGLRGEKHRAEPEELAFEPEGVVPADEGTRVCEERSTTPSRRNSRLSLRAWCSSTKEQGFAGREAPRRTGGRDIRVALPVRTGPAPRRSAAGWHQKAELLQQLRDIIILSDENRDSISENPSRIGLVREIHEGVLCGIVGNGSV